MKKSNYDSNHSSGKQFSIRTDLAIEAHEMLQESTASGIKVETDEEGSVRTTWVQILNETGSKTMGKDIGNYVTIESEAMKENDTQTHEQIVKIMAEAIGKLHNLKENSVVLVVGLGNWNVTPDALGPKVVSKLLVTRHVADALPEELDGKVRAVSAISPGVMGLTGIETVEIVRGVTDRVKPDLVIAIDALAARRTSRINSTIQISDTGINPGAGIGNKRASLNEKTLQTPVMAIGIPTVVDAATLVNDTMDKMLESMIAETPEGSEFYEMLNNLEGEEKYRLIYEILTPYAGNMFVTPKEVDAVVERLSAIIANALNIALHPGIDISDINRYLN